MHAFIETTIKYPVLALFLVIGIGYILGEINFFGFKFGIAGVLFAGLGIGCLDPKIALPEMVPTMGLIIFVYMIGLHSAPALVAAIKQKGYKDSLFTAAVLTFGAVITFGCATFLQMNGPRAAGLFCGSVTNTPALAAARETVREISVKQGVKKEDIDKLAEQPVVSYSIAYPLGVVGVLLCIQLMRKVWKIKPRDVSAGPPIEVKSFLVSNPDLEGKTIGEMQAENPGAFTVTRIQKKGRTDIATLETKLEMGNIVAVVGNEDAHRLAESIFGEPSATRIERDSSKLEYRRLFVSSSRVVGCRISELNLDEFPATISRIRRGDSDLVATPDTQLEHGDMLRVISNRENFPKLQKFFGDSIRGMAEADFGALALGMVMGVLVGLIPIPLPNGTSLRLGVAGGPLIVALILGKLGRTGRINWVIPTSANFTLRQIGLLLFLAGVGSRAGWAFLQTIRTNGVPTLVSGALVTFGITLATLIFGYKVLKMPFDFLTGVLSGIQTQPACLAFACNHAKNDEPNVGYAGVYPAATISKIILAQLLVTLIPAGNAATLAASAPPPAPSAVTATAEPAADASESTDASAAPAPAKKKLKPVATKLIRPGFNGVTSIPPVSGCLISTGFSREANATGSNTAGQTTFVECTVAKGFALVTVPTHWVWNKNGSGVGDTSWGAKYVFNKETARVPLFAVGYILKQPTAADKLGTGFFDHKVTAYADKNFGTTRLTGNFIVKWEGEKDGFLKQYMPSVGVLRPIYGKWGVALQSYYSFSEVVKYGGSIGAATYHFTPSLSAHLGYEHGYGPKSPNSGVVWGLTYLYRGFHHRG